MQKAVRPAPSKVYRAPLMIKFYIFYCKRGYRLVKVAIFGGSFDPPHKGHQEIVEKALKLLDIDRLIILPAFLNPFKEHSLASAEQRLQWCQTLFAALPRVEVSDYEIRMGRPVYTVESLRHFQKKYEVVYLIIGADNLPTIEHWRDFDTLNREVTWAVAGRAGCPLHTEKLKRWVFLPVDQPISSTEIREKGALAHVDPRIRAEVETLLKKQKKKK